MILEFSAVIVMIDNCQNERAETNCISHFRSAVNRNVLPANKEMISPAKRFELLIAGHAITAIFFDLGNGNLLPQKWFGLSWSLEPL